MRLHKIILVFVLLFNLSSVAAAKKNKEADVEVGDQAKREIARGFYIQPNIGLLTFLVGDGALVYRPGIMLDIRFGYDVAKNISVYGLLGTSITPNTNCFRNPGSGESCKSVRDTFASQKDLQVPRQAFFLDVGAGVKYDFLTIDERLIFHLTGELMLQLIAPDPVLEGEETKMAKLDEKRKSWVIGGGVGVGIGVEYFFVMKHFSFNADAKAFFFPTPFMPAGSSGGLAGMLGLGLFVSAGIKYTF